MEIGECETCEGMENVRKKRRKETKEEREERRTRLTKKVKLQNELQFSIITIKREDATDEKRYKVYYKAKKQEK